MAEKFICDFNSNGELEVYVVRDNKKHVTRNRKYIIDEMSAFLEANCIVKIRQTELALKDMDSGESVTIKNYDEVLDQPDFARIKENIQQLISRRGYIVDNNISKINRKPKRSNKSTLVKKVATFVIGASLAIEVLSSALFEINMRANATETAYLNRNVVSVEDTNNYEDSIYSKIDIGPAESVATTTLDIGSDGLAETPTIDTESEKTVKTSPVETSADIEDKKVTVVNLEFDDLSQSPKANRTKSNYYDLLVQAGKRFGIDPNLLLGVATEEGEIHVPEVNDGGAIGLMQIQYDVWVKDNVNLPYYELNPNTGKFERHVLDRVTDAMVKDLNKNIEIGCMILQDCLRKSNYNLTVALQMYNMGLGTINNVIDAYAAATGKTREQVINDPYDIGWLQYRKIKDENGYVEHVNKWIDDNEFSITNVTNGEVISVAYTNENERNIHR